MGWKEFTEKLDKYRTRLGRDLTEEDVYLTYLFENFPEAESNLHGHLCEVHREIVRLEQGVGFYVPAY